MPIGDIFLYSTEPFATDNTAPLLVVDSPELDISEELVAITNREDIAPLKEFSEVLIG